MRDDPDFNIDLVQEIENFPCLYEPTHEDYTKRHVLDKVWKHLSIKFGEPVEALRSRWKNLRSRHFKVKNHTIFGTKRKSYYLSEYLQFLDRIGESKIDESTDGNLEALIPLNNEEVVETALNVKTESSADDNLDVNDNDGNDKANCHLSESLPNVTASSDDEPLGETRSVRNRSEFPAGNRHIRNARDDSQSSDQTTSDEVNRFALQYFIREATEGSASKKLSLDDPDIAFLYSLLPDIKQMNVETKRKFKLKLLQLVDEILSKQA